MKTISNVFDIQKAFSGHWTDFDNLAPEEREQRAKDYLLEIYGEVDELKKEIDTKAWRRSGSGNITEIKKEASDVLAYLISICLCYGITGEEFADTYVEKMKQNEKEYNERRNRR